jgi:hypothetical protein
VLVAEHLQHGYARTVHKTQGLTCDVALLLGDDTLYADFGYTGLTPAATRTTSTPSLSNRTTPVVPHSSRRARPRHQPRQDGCGRVPPAGRSMNRADGPPTSDDDSARASPPHRARLEQRLRHVLHDADVHGVARVGESDR